MRLMGLISYLRGKKAVAGPVEPGQAKIEALPVTVKVGPAMLDSDFASLEAAGAAIERITSHLAYRAKIGKDESENCDQLRQKLKKLRAYVAALEAAE
jgi:hypothetical protein